MSVSRELRLPSFVLFTGIRAVHSFIFRYLRVLYIILHIGQRDMRQKFGIADVGETIRKGVTKSKI